MRVRVRVSLEFNVYFVFCSKLFFTKTLKITTPTLTLIGHMESNFRVNGNYLMHVMVRAVRCCRLVLGVSVRLGVR